MVQGSSVPNSSAQPTSRPTLAALHNRVQIVVLMELIGDLTAGSLPASHSLRSGPSRHANAPVARRPHVVVCLQESKAQPLDGVQAQQRVQPDLRQRQQADTQPRETS